jgi:hypothetical protein
VRKNKLIALVAVAMVSIPATCSTAAAVKASKTAQQTDNQMWPAETLSGKITMVDPARRLVVVQDSSGVPFDMVVGRSTHIKSANGMLSLNALKTDLNRSVTIKFVPESRGDVAKAINVSQ